MGNFCDIAELYSKEELQQKFNSEMNIHSDLPEYILNPWYNCPTKKNRQLLANAIMVNYKKFISEDLGLVDFYDYISQYYRECGLTQTYLDYYWDKYVKTAINNIPDDIIDVIDEPVKEEHTVIEMKFIKPRNWSELLPEEQHVYVQEYKDFIRKRLCIGKRITTFNEWLWVSKCVEHGLAGTMSKDIYNKIISRDKNRCCICGKPAYRVGMILPYRYGGEKSLDNAGCLCEDCFNVGEKDIYIQLNSENKPILTQGKGIESRQIQSVVGKSLLGLN